MSTFTKEDFRKHDYKYSLALLKFIKENKSIHIELTIKQSKTLSEVTIINDDYVKSFEKAIYEKDLLPPVGNFNTVSGEKISFTKIYKQDFSGFSKAKSKNSLGRKLANAGELATIVSLTKDINTPQDTQQDVFINDPELFLDWKNTFDNTKIKVKEICGDINQFEIIHDATDKTGFSQVIEKTASRLGISKDAYNPADIYLVRKNKKNEVLTELKEILNESLDNATFQQKMNQKIYNLYLKKDLYPISLKQLKDSGKIEYANKPSQKLPDYEIKNISCNMSWTTGKEIEVITFTTNDNEKINTQIRGFPHGYGISQMEITSDGSKSGGRLGKVPTNVIDRTLSQYNYSRIKSITYFGTKKISNGKELFLENFDKSKVDYWYKVYNSLRSKIQGNHESISNKDFENLITYARHDSGAAANLVMKIQGLNFLNFYVMNMKNINSIVSKIIYGAKKMSSDNSFFIKIY